ncbi:MAG TPA: VCBS repeat-containing protein [Thermoanaerobaculia bacterium]|nr:VCBS repeat-containing protein [Thermoanaerobaculia bacterium]
MKRGAFMRCLATLLLAPWLVAAAPPAPQPPRPAGLTSGGTGGARWLDAVVPGRVLSAALPTGADGRARIALLVAPDGPTGAPRSLFLFDPQGDGALREAIRGLPAAADTLDVVDLDGDGSQELLLGEPGKLHSLGPVERLALSPRPLLSDPALDPAVSQPARWPPVGRRDGGQLEVVDVGHVRVYTRDGAGALALAAEHELPVRARRDAAGLLLSTPRVTVLPRPGGPSLYVAGPEAHGKTRLRTVLIDPAAPESSRRIEAWAQLPGPEEVIASWYVLLDGRPFLVVTTAGSEKVGLFEKQRLRVFPLAADRSRAGRRPVLAFETESRRWNAVAPAVLDIDRDGREDLVVVQPEGLAGKTLVAQAWLGRGDGGFQPGGRRTALDIEAGAWSYGRDLTGDGIADLVAMSEDRLLTFAGMTDPKGKNVLERKPWKTVTFHPAASGQTVREVSIGTGGTQIEGGDVVAPGTPYLIDLEGDGRAEVIFLTPDERGHGSVQVVRLGG